MCFWNKFKQHFENRTWARAAMFEICARTVVSCLRSAHARRLLWEPPDMFIDVHSVLFWCKGSLFSKPFSVHFFSEKWWQMDTNMASKVETILSKMTLKMKSKKHAQNVLKLMPRDLWKTTFRLGLFYKITKTRGANKCKNMSKKDVNISSKSMKNGPWSSTKNDA